MSHSSTPNDRFARAVAAFAAVHQQDPTQVMHESGPVAQAWLSAERLRAELSAWAPTASEALRLAVCCHHLGRFQWPRSTFPAGRAGYLRWRRELSGRHAAAAAAILRDVGYDAAFIERVQALVMKRNLKGDSEVQCLEDVICFAFLRHELDAFARKHPPAKVIDILRKTWNKMSPAAQAHALTLPLSVETQHWVKQALQG